jgi:hypothetical protein
MKTKIEINLADILERKYPRGFHVPADIDITNFLEFADEDWQHEIDLHELLASDRRVALVYSTEDVKAVRPGLDDDQAWEILRQFAATCKDGPTPMLDTMRQLAEMTYPNGKQLLRERLARLARDIDALPDQERDNPAAYGEAAAKLDAVECQVKGA